ncbi:MAG: hypothetical protein M3P44_04220 [Actinomycetota bacterium]|nr:hypothetical protein [Actinomycetota bacterium]
MKLDLHERRDARGMLATTFALFTAHATVFFTMSLILVAPVTIVVDGIWGRALAEGADAAVPQAATITTLLLQALVIAPVATALHAVCVLAIVRGEEPQLGRAYRGALPFLAPAIGAVALAGIGIAAGLVLVIVPGVYLAVRWYLGAVAATIDGLAPIPALRRSAELVEGAWWATFGRLLLAAVAFGFVALVGQLLAVATGSGALFVSLLAVTQAVAVSLSAIFATLLFFELRARKESQPA